jgi:hypothetical protein
MKTVTLSHDQWVRVCVALRSDIKLMENALLNAERYGGEVMYWRDQLDIARQALALVEG